MQNQNFEFQSDIEKVSPDEKRRDREERKQFPFRRPSLWTVRINLLKTVFSFTSLWLTLATFHFYYIATFRERDIDKKLFIIILGCELVPRIAQVYLLHKYTKENSGFGFQDGLGVFLCGSTYYFWRGRDRANLTRQNVNKLGYIMDGLQVAKFIFICYVLGTQLDQPRSEDDPTNDQVIDKLTTAGSTLLVLLFISAVLYILRFMWFLFKKIGRCCFGDDWLRR